MIHLTEELKGIRTVAVAGHIRPDGDCVGSCLAVCNYIREQFPEIQVQVYLEPFAKSFGFLKYADTVRPAQGWELRFPALTGQGKPSVWIIISAIRDMGI